MEYLVVFLEGIVTFLSPCLLPMLPIYLSYFAGGGERKSAATLKNALGFVAGFTIVFLLMGAFAGVMGGLLTRYQRAVDLLTGAVVVMFGLSYLGLFQLNIFRGNQRAVQTEGMGFFRAVLFGIVFAVGWTPCVGTFLGSALMLAGSQGTAVKGILMLLFYSLGLGIPFLLSAVLIDQLKGAFRWVKEHYALIDRISGAFLVLVGILMMTGRMGRLLTFLQTV